MSEIREKAVRLLLQAAYEMAADNADSVADIFDCQHGFIDDLRRRAMLKLDKPYKADDMARLWEIVNNDETLRVLAPVDWN